MYDDDHNDQEEACERARAASNSKLLYFSNAQHGCVAVACVHKSQTWCTQQQQQRQAVHFALLMCACTISVRLYAAQDGKLVVESSTEVAPTREN